MPSQRSSTSCISQVSTALCQILLMTGVYSTCIGRTAKSTNNASLWHVAAQTEINELERLISQYQEVEEDEQGDLLDDFVLSATLVQL